MALIAQNHIRQVREELGMTLEQFSERTGYNRDFLIGLEEAQKKISSTVLQNIAAALNCFPVDLTSNIREMRRTLSAHTDADQSSSDVLMQARGYHLNKVRAGRALHA